MRENKDYLITEKPSRALLIFSIPMIIGNLFQQAYTIVDSAIVGRYVGETALAAVGASYALTSIFICIAIGGGIGASVIISHHFGGHNYGRMKTGIRTALLSFLFISLILGGIGLIFSQQIMEVLNTPADAIDIAVTYLNIYFLGLPFLFMYNILSSMFNALGESRIPLYLLIFSSVLNIFLDLYMVAVLNLGVAGAAYATFIAQGISAVLSLIIFIVTLQKLPGKAEGWLSKTEFSDMSRIALPSILQQSTVSIGMMLVQSVVNSFGTQILAGFSAAMRIESLCVVPMSAIGNAMSSYTAQNIGAEKEERISQGYRMGNFMIIVIAVILCLFLEIAHKPLIALFLDNAASSQTIVTGESYLKFIGFFFCMIGFKMAVDGILRGAGAVRVFYYCEPGKSNIASYHCKIRSSNLGSFYGMVCSTAWLACQLSDFLWILQNWKVERSCFKNGRLDEESSKSHPLYL